MIFSHQRPLIGDARSEAIDALHAATAIYTREAVVDDLLDRISWPQGGRKLVDPSCGDGMFLARAMARCPDIGAVGQIEGWEIHPAAAAAARARLAAVLVDKGMSAAGARSVAHQVVRNGDFLVDGPRDRRYHVIAGNPPYLRAAAVPALLRAEYALVTPAHARADLLHAFLDRCAEVLTDDGEVAFVTDDRWLFNVGAAGLRASVGRRLGIDHLQRLDPASAFYRPKHRRAGTPPRIHPVAVVLRGRDRSATTLGGDAVYPDAADDVGDDGRRLGDIARVRLAPWLGSFGVFVLATAAAAHLPAEMLVPCVDTDDIVDGRLRQPGRVAIRTTPNAEPPRSVMRHLDATLYRMAPRGRRNPRWLSPESWHHIDLSTPSLLVPRIARSLRPVRVPAGVLPINHNISIVAAGSVDLEEIEAILSSERANAWIRERAARLENGYLSVTTTLLRQLPVE